MKAKIQHFGLALLIVISACQSILGSSKILGKGGILSSQKYKDIRNIDSSVQAIRDKVLFEKKGAKNSLIERRFFNEGSIDSLEVDLPNNDTVIGFLFVKSNPYKDKVYGRYFSDLIVAYSKTSLYLYDMAGALMSSLVVGKRRT